LLFAAFFVGRFFAANSINMYKYVKYLWFCRLRKYPNNTRNGKGRWSNESENAEEKRWGNRKLKSGKPGGTSCWERKMGNANKNPEWKTNFLYLFLFTLE